MATPRQKTEVFQACRSVEIVEPPADALGPFRPYFRTSNSCRLQILPNFSELNLIFIVSD